MTKTYQDSILKILSTAEEALLEIIKRAAATGDYEGIDLARGTAGEIKRISIQLSTEISNSVNGRSNSEMERFVQEKRPSSKREVSKFAYPRFEISESTLTKVGWSKKRRKEYAHCIRRDVFEAVVAAIAASRRDTEGPLSTVFIREVLAAGADTVPSYQMYLVLGFLRSREVIRLSARGAYHIPSNVSDRAHAEWLKAESGSK